MSTLPVFDHICGLYWDYRCLLSAYFSSGFQVVTATLCVYLDQLLFGRIYWLTTRLQMMVYAGPVSTERWSWGASHVHSLGVTHDSSNIYIVVRISNCWGIPIFTTQIVYLITITHTKATSRMVRYVLLSRPMTAGLIPSNILASRSKAPFFASPLCRNT